MDDLRICYFVSVVREWLSASGALVSGSKPFLWTSFRNGSIRQLNAVESAVSDLLPECLLRPLKAAAESSFRIL